jgi:glucokinase
MCEIVFNFIRLYPECFKKNNFNGIGLASAGPLNVDQGILIYPVNFKDWKIVALVKMLQTKLKKLNQKNKRLPLLKVYFQNDAMAAALAEKWIGAAQNLTTFAVVTVGTGIGTGVIFKNRPLQSKGMGSEFGHLIADLSKIKNPTQRSHYSIEGLASGIGILRQAQEMGFTGSSIEELVLESKKYQILFDQAAVALAVLCYNLSIGFHPEKILFSGGLIKIKHLYWKKMKAHYEALIKDFNPNFKAPLALARARNQAGVLGAGYLPYISN